MKLNHLKMFIWIYAIPKYKFYYNSGLDSNTVSIQINFDKTFRKFFPEGIKIFSTVNKDRLDIL